LTTKKNPDVSIILPCRNEEKALETVINQIKKVINTHNLNAEIIVSDSSSDRSPEIAKKLGVKLVKHDKVGYGIAYLEGFKAAKGKYIVVGDADGTYDFRNIPNFLKFLKQGNDFVIGNRFKGRIEKKAMPSLHKYIGNPLFSFIFRLFFKSDVRDTHCGLRGLRKDCLQKLNLQTTGMEFASEMIIQAIRNNLKIKQLPIHYHARIGKSKLSSFSDGWRHLRFMLMYAPDYLFLIPGMFLILVGFIIMGFLLKGPVKIDGLVLYTHPMVIGSFLTILGYQIVTLGIYAKTYAVSAGLEKNDKFIDQLSKLVKFESGIVIGGVLLIISFILGLIILFNWVTRGFPALLEINNVIFILTLGVIGVQTIFSAFFISILLVEKKH
jgi:glycosyltransferase involved in cell wall biosynthesis